MSRKKQELIQHAMHSAHADVDLCTQTLWHPALSEVAQWILCLYGLLFKNNLARFFSNTLRNPGVDSKNAKACQHLPRRLAAHTTS